MWIGSRQKKGSPKAAQYGALKEVWRLELVTQLDEADMGLVIRPGIGAGQVGAGRWCIVVVNPVIVAVAQVLVQIAQVKLEAGGDVVAQSGGDGLLDLVVYLAVHGKSRRECCRVNGRSEVLGAVNAFVAIAGANSQSVLDDIHIGVDAGGIVVVLALGGPVEVVDVVDSTVRVGAAGTRR